MEALFALYLYPLLKAAMMSLGTMAVGYLVRKYQLNILAGKEAEFASKILNRVFHFDELSASMLKLGQTPLTGESKFNSVVEWVMKQQPKITDEKAKELVEDVVAMCPQVGAFKDTGAGMLGQVGGLGGFLGM
jgi:hypothetical protein